MTTTQPSIKQQLHKLLCQAAGACTSLTNCLSQTLRNIRCMDIEAVLDLLVGQGTTRQTVLKVMVNCGLDMDIAMEYGYIPPQTTRYQASRNVLAAHSASWYAPKHTDAYAMAA